jgi:ERF superfamily
MIDYTPITQATPNLFAALAKAQGEIQSAKKDSLNPHFKSKYADLASVWDACREPLSRNELSVVQVVRMSQGQLVLRTILGHSSGEEAPYSDFPILAQRQDSQSIGSAMTYARRYSLAALVGVAPEDDDGEGAGRSDGSSVKPQPAKPPMFAHELKSAPAPATQAPIAQGALPFATQAPLPSFKPATKAEELKTPANSLPPMPPPLPGSTLYNKIEETPIAKAAKKLAEKEAAKQTNDDDTGLDVPW